MTDEIKLNRDAARASRAQALLENDLFAESLKYLEEAYIKAWRETVARDTDARERLWQAVQVVGKVRDHLGKVVADGKLAQAELKALAQLTAA